MKQKTVNQGYTIIERFTVGEQGFALGENLKAPSPYVTWQYQAADTNHFYWGHYFTEKLQAYNDYVLIDCMPSLGMITVNALAAADSVIIPVQAHYLPAKGMAQLLQTINRVKKNINPSLKIDGVLLTMVDARTNFAKDVSYMYAMSGIDGDNGRIFKVDDSMSLFIEHAVAAAKQFISDRRQLNKDWKPKTK